MPMNIAIDGPAGAGKSTIAKQVAKELDYIYVDTGAMYRAIALYLIESGVDIENENAIEHALEGCQVALSYQEGKQRVLLGERDVSERIRTEEIGNSASRISVFSCVRQKLTAMQRELAAREDLVMDGRDIGTTVLPQAPLKIYLTASVETRAKRRALEYEHKGEDYHLEEIKRDIEARDERDMKREIAPLAQAKDAVYVDSSDMSIAQVVAQIIALAKERRE